MRKKIIGLMMLAAVTVSAAACGGKGETSTEQSQETAAGSQQEAQETAEKTEEAENGENMGPVRIATKPMTEQYILAVSYTHLRACVKVEGRTIGEIGKGFLLLVGVADSDTKEIADKMVNKICKLRIFEDENGKTNLSLADVEMCIRDS